MQIHELTTSYKKKRKQRVGRGGKRGSYSGKGIKGQRSRAGHRIRPQIRDIIKKIHKKRGYRNRPIHAKPIPVQLRNVEKLFDVQEKITVKTLREKLQIKRIAAFKILGGGAIKKKLIVKGVALSKGARDAIEKAGGEIYV